MSTQIDGEHLFILGETTIQETQNRLTVPETVTATDILQPGLPVYWGYSDEFRAHLLGRTRYCFDVMRVPSKRPTTLTTRRVLTIPKFYFADYIGSKSPIQRPRPEKERLEYGRPMVFATTDLFEEWGACLLLPADHELVADPGNEPCLVQ